MIEHWSGADPPVEWATARFILKEPVAGISRIVLGAVTVGPGKLCGRVDFAQAAATLLHDEARLVMVIAQPQRRITKIVQGLAEELRRWDHCRVELIAEAYLGSVSMLALGRIAGFDGDSLPSSAVAEGERPLTQAAWKAAVLQDPMDYQGTLKMLLPPIKTRLAIRGCVRPAIQRRS